MQIRCDECGSIFDFSDDEQQFYKSKGFQLPKRCKICRSNRKTRNESLTPNIGYKVSSFCENAQLFGMPVDVTTRPSVEFSYTISADSRNKQRFIHWDRANNQYEFVDTEAEASGHEMSKELRDFRSFLEQSYTDYKFTLNPHSVIVSNTAEPN